MKALRTRLKVRLAPSPHHRSRGGAAVDLIVLHSITCPPGSFDTGDVEDLFRGRLDLSRHPSYGALRGVELSAHFLVDRRGRTVQFVDTDRAAYHAGRSSWEGRGECNDYSVGVELTGDDLHDFTLRQYRTLARLCRDVMRAHPAVTAARIVGHRDVAPGRKTDPGPRFDWERLRRLLGPPSGP